MRSPKAIRLTPALLLAGFIIIPGTAEAATVNCGQVITQNTVLDADVGPCPGNGIVIGASGITLDLAGHTVSGASSTGAGVLVAAPHGGVTVRNGTVTGFDIGVNITQSSGNTVERVLALGNCIGLRLQGISVPLNAANNVVRGNVVRGNRCSGITLFQNTTGSTVERNDIAANGGPGISLVATGPNNSPRFNRFGQNYVRTNSANGILLGVGVLGNTVTGNLIAGNAASGVKLAGSEGIGAVLNTVEQNQVRDNGVDGVVAQRFSSSNQIRANTSLGNRRYDLAEENSSCFNTWTGNTFVTKNHACIS